jgi:hypothetical protein
MALACARPVSDWYDALALTLGRSHSGIAELGGGRYMTVAARPDDPAMSLDAAHALSAWATRANAYVGMVTVDAATVGAVGEREIRRLAEAALFRALARRDEGVERVERFAIGRAAPSAEDSGYDARNGPEP